MADGVFDRAAFTEELATRRLGRTLITRADTDSTNDDAWDAAAHGGDDGLVVIADRQLRGRGREGRAWHTAPGLGLAMSVLLKPGCDPSALGTSPLVAGLALAQALDTFGLASHLKWPNDVLAGGRKLAGLLCESRRLADGTAAVVVGAGVNVAERREDFPPELSGRVTSLALEGVSATREAVAARFLTALEKAWDEHQERDPRTALDAWRARARWGVPVTVHAPHGVVTGVTDALDDDGALVVRLADGTRTRVVAGDVELDPSP